MRVNRAEFLRKLQMVSAGLTKSSKEGIEQGDCFVFHDGRIITFNDEISCSVESPLDITGAITAKPLMELLNKLKEDEVDITVKASEVLVKGKKRRAGIPMEAEVNLPVETIEPPNEWKELPSEFAEAIDIVHRCALSGDNDPTLACVHIHPEHLEACDGMQVARWILKTGVENSCLVRRDSVKYVTNLGMSEVSESESWIHFRNEAGLVLSCRRWEDEYQNLDDILKVEGHKVILPVGLAEAVDKAVIFSSDGTVENNVRVDLKKGMLKIRGEGPSGWYEEKKKVDYKGDRLSFLIAPKILTELLKRSNECFVTKERLRMGSGNWVYVACLGVIKEKE